LNDARSPARRTEGRARLLREAHPLRHAAHRSSELLEGAARQPGHLREVLAEPVHARGRLAERGLELVPGLLDGGAQLEELLPGDVEPARRRRERHHPLDLGEAPLEVANAAIHTVETLFEGLRPRLERDDQ